jgi:hypothetical protein
VGGGISPSWLQWPRIEPGGDQEVVGESSYQDALLAVAGGRTPDGTAVRLVTAQLVREPSNPHNRNAVRVDVGGAIVGYLPREDAKRFHRLLAELEADGLPATCRASLTGGWDRGPSDRGHIGVVLDVRRGPRRSGEETPFLPGGNRFAVVGEEAHQEHLGAMLGSSPGRECVARLEPHGSEVEVLIEGRRVGQLSDVISERYAPWVCEVVVAGLPTTCTAWVERGKRKIEVYVSLTSIV